MEYTSYSSQLRLAYITRAKIDNEAVSPEPHLRRLVLLCITLDNFTISTYGTFLPYLGERAQKDASKEARVHRRHDRSAWCNHSSVVVHTTELDSDSDSESDAELEWHDNDSLVSSATPATEDGDHDSDCNRDEWDDANESKNQQPTFDSKSAHNSFRPHQWPRSPAIGICHISRIPTGCERSQSIMAVGNNITPTTEIVPLKAVTDGLKAGDLPTKTPIVASHSEAVIALCSTTNSTFSDV